MLACLVSQRGLIPKPFVFIFEALYMEKRHVLIVQLSIKFTRRDCTYESYERKKRADVLIEHDI